MKRMICYFALCALILGCIAGCLSVEPEKSTEPSGNASVQGTATLPDVALNTLPAADWDLYILTGTNEIVYYTSKANNHYGFYIYSKEPLDVYSIEVTLPISHGYEVSVKECTLGGIQADVDAGARDDEHLFSSDSFSYPLYLAYRDMDFAKLALLREEWRALYAQYEAGGYTEQWLNGELTREEYEQLREPHETAKAEYDAALNAQWEDYLALTAEDLPPFYVYHVGIAFSYQTIEAEESFTQMEISIGDQVYHQPIGKITLKGELEAPAPIDWGEE